MKLVYIAGPYNADTTYARQKNIEAARDEAAVWWQKGYAVICPHMNTANMDGVVERDVWLAGDFEIIRRCDIIVMLPGWEESAGAREEFEVAVAHVLVIYYVSGPQVQKIDEENVLDNA